MQITKDNEHVIVDIGDMVRFMTAGNATFTIVNTDTGNRFTYKVTKVKRPSTRGPSHFVGLMTGSDNENSFSYIGCLYGMMADYRHGTKSRIGIDAPGVKAYRWLCKRLRTGAALPPSFEFWHEGRCGRCGRKLTDPVSIEAGFGPECRQHSFC